MLALPNPQVKHDSRRPSPNAIPPARCHSERSVATPSFRNRAFTISGRDAKSKNPSSSLLMLSSRGPEQRSCQPSITQFFVLYFRDQTANQEQMNFPVRTYTQTNNSIAVS